MSFITALFGGGVSFTAAQDIPSLKGKVVLVTGGNSGLGKQSIRPLDLDLTSFESIKKAAARFTSEADRLDILMLNAGIMATSAGLTKEGYEIQFGTNHVGHALLTKLLMPLLLKTAEEKSSGDEDMKNDVRVVVLSSAGHQIAPTGGIQFDTLKGTQEKMTTWTRYGQSKLANILFAKEMAKRYPQITSVSLHPGAVNTNLTKPMADRFLFARLLTPLVSRVTATVETGAKNQLWAATSKQGIANGEYYTPVGVSGKGSAYSTDGKLAAQLWEWTEKELEGQSI
jgi:retinol dehydrogenase-12